MTRFAPRSRRPSRNRRNFFRQLGFEQVEDRRLLAALLTIRTRPTIMT